MTAIRLRTEGAGIARELMPEGVMPVTVTTFMISILITSFVGHDRSCMIINSMVPVTAWPLPCS